MQLALCAILFAALQIWTLQCLLLAMSVKVTPSFMLHDYRAKGHPTWTPFNLQSQEKLGNTFSPIHVTTEHLLFTLQVSRKELDKVRSCKSNLNKMLARVVELKQVCHVTVSMLCASFATSLLTVIKHFLHQSVRSSSKL